MPGARCQGISTAFATRPFDASLLKDVLRAAERRLAEIDELMSRAQFDDVCCWVDSYIDIYRDQLSSDDGCLFRDGPWLFFRCDYRRSVPEYLFSEGWRWSYEERAWGRSLLPVDEVWADKEDIAEWFLKLVPLADERPAKTTGPAAEVDIPQVEDLSDADTAVVEPSEADGKSKFASILSRMLRM